MDENFLLKQQYALLNTELSIVISNIEKLEQEFNVLNDLLNNHLLINGKVIEKENISLLSKNFNEAKCILSSMKKQY